MKPARHGSSRKVEAAADVVGAGVASTHADYGRLRYEWISTDVDEDGDYLGQFQVTYTDGTIDYWPTAEDGEESFLLIRIQKQV
jgi:hypothetical protein